MFPNTLNQEVKSDTAINGRVLINEFSRLIDICDLKDQKIKVMYGQKKNDSLLVLSLNNRIFLQQYEYNVVIMKERETNQTLSDKLSRNSIEMDQTLRKSRRIIIGESIAIFILTSILLIK
jgi:hypothetical protein